ncbi:MULTISPECIES: hypothetical protein [Pseudomonas]|uniref:hypothetical protein n=1 Tax=Pseudomonas TaxID=286 RepID=UPI001E4AA416|nr:MULTISPECIES: hypothetical protein [Pseudomonas]MCE1114805.1 hypothetical protein [Pseudomonas sp. NMI795_08]
MKKLVPDPPIPYITIIDHLTHDAAMAHAAVLMSTMSRTLEAYRAFDEDDRPMVLMENVAILSQLLRCLFDHARSLQVTP